jgi:hypothetical protein
VEVVQTGAQCTMPSTPTPTPTAAAPERIRLTITVTPEVHATFQRMAAAGSMSISRAMGDWLGDTLDAATYAASMMEKARAAPQMVARELHAYALGMADETQAFMRTIQSGSLVDRSEVPPPLSPPSSNTGGKVPRRSSRKSSGGQA